MRMQTAQAIRWRLPLRRAALAISVIVITLVGAADVKTNIINVPGDQPTIQGGINAAMLISDTV